MCVESGDNSADVAAVVRAVLWLVVGAPGTVVERLASCRSRALSVPCMRLSAVQYWRPVSHTSMFAFLRLTWKLECRVCEACTAMDARPPRLHPLQCHLYLSNVRGLHCVGCAHPLQCHLATTALSTAIMTIVGEHIDVRVPKVDLFECARRALQWMRVHRDCIHCNVTSICQIRPALRWMCASIAMSSGYYCAKYRDHDDRWRTVLKDWHMIRHTTNGSHMGRIQLSLIS